jgi:hypothetical protein
VAQTGKVGRPGKVEPPRAQSHVSSSSTTTQRVVMLSMMTIGLNAAALLLVAVLSIRFEWLRAEESPWPIYQSSSGLVLLLTLGTIGVGLVLLLVGRRAIRAQREDLGSLAIGLAYGGMVWFLSAVMLAPSAGELLRFLREHAFDYFAAGGVAAVATYFLVDAERPVRNAAQLWLSELIAAVTAFSIGATWYSSMLTIVVFGITGFVFSYYPSPASDPGNKGRLPGAATTDATSVKQSALQRQPQARGQRSPRNVTRGPR